MDKFMNLLGRSDCGYLVAEHLTPDEIDQAKLLVDRGLIIKTLAPEGPVYMTLAAAKFHGIDANGLTA